jgi:hypothetical protein
LLRSRRKTHARREQALLEEGRDFVLSRQFRAF